MILLISVSLGASTFVMRAAGGPNALYRKSARATDAPPPLPSDIPVEELLELLLLSAAGYGLPLALRVLRELLEGGLSGEDALGESVLLPGEVTLLDDLVEEALVHQLHGSPEPAGQAVHASDVRHEHVLQVRGLPPQLAVEVVAARRDAALLQDDEHAEQRLARVRGELVRVPAEVGLTRVAVHGAEHAEGRGHAEVVLVVVARQRRVVRLDVDLEVLLQAVGAQEADDRLGVVVVLVRRRLPRLRLDEQLVGGADLLLVLDAHPEEGGEVVELGPDVRVERRLEALAAAPEDVVGGAKLVGDLQHLLGLRAGVREGREVRGRRRAV